MDTYEKKYKDALEWMREMYPCLTDSLREDADYYFPELRESEDERALRIIKKRMCYDPVPISDEDRRIVENWLEKQKEPHYTKRNALFDKCVENCDPEVMKSVSDEVDEMLEKEQKPIQTSEEKEYIRTLKSLISDFIRDKQPEDVIFYQKIYDWLDGRHIEQEPNIELIQRSWYMEGYHDREFGKEPKWIIKTGEGGPKHELNPRYGEPLFTKQNPVKWTELTWKDIVELEGIINNVHYEFRNGIGQESFGKEVLEKFREYKGEYLDEIEQKPAEWSEEDEKRIQRICDFLWKNRKGDTDTIYQIEKDADWLKSLRPDSYKNCNSRWKPSEEQMKALHDGIEWDEERADDYDRLMQSLYHDLMQLK